MKKNITLILGTFIIVPFLSLAQNNTIPNAGNVGLGTINPTAKLDVNGNVKIDSTLLVKDSMIVERDLRVEGGIKMSLNSVAENNFTINGFLNLPNADNVSENTFLAGGHNILLQELTTGTVKELDYANFQNFILNVAYGQPPLGISCSSTSPEILTPTWNNGVKKLFVPCPSVKVGIGTSTPLYSLHTNGDGFFALNLGVGDDPHTDVQLNAKTNRKVGYCVNHGYAGDFGYAFKGIVNKETTKGIGIYNGVYQKDVFTVYGNGKIEVSNDAGKILQLESDGLLRARAIRVDLNTWADYVFDDTYQLSSLDTVEAYINENGHLPNIPSAEEMKEQGMDVSEMSNLLLEKIEELTLYIIEQNKLIEGLQERVGSLEQP